MPCTESPHPYHGSPVASVQKLATGTEASAGAGARGPCCLWRPGAPPCCSAGAGMLLLEPLPSLAGFGQGCWFLQAINGSYGEYFPRRITISIVSAPAHFSPSSHHQSLKIFHAISPLPSLLLLTTEVQSVPLLSWR